MPKWKFFINFSQDGNCCRKRLQKMVTKENQSKGKRVPESKILGVLQLQPLLAPGVFLH